MSAPTERDAHSTSVDGDETVTRSVARSATMMCARKRPLRIATLQGQRALTIRHLSFRARSDLNTRLLRPGVVESTCRVHMRSESGHCESQATKLLFFHNASS